MPVPPSNEVLIRSLRAARPGLERAWQEERRQAGLASLEASASSFPLDAVLLTTETLLRGGEAGARAAIKAPRNLNLEQALLELRLLRRALGAWAEEQQNLTLFQCRALHESIDLVMEATAAGFAQAALTTSREREREAARRQAAEIDLESYFNLPGLLFSLEAGDAQFRRLSPAWEVALGHSLAELQSRPFYDFVHPDDLEATRAEHARLLRGEPTSGFLNRYRCRDGSYKWLSWTSRNLNGLFYSFAIDVTALKETDQQLRQLYERFDRISEATDLGVWYCDLPFDVLEWNPRVKEHFWLAPDAHVTIETFYDRIHPDDRDFVRTSIAESIAEHRRYDIVYRTVNPEDPAQVKSIRAAGWTAYRGSEPVRFDGITLDVTEPKRIEDELRLSAERFRTLTQAAPQIVWVADASGHVNWYGQQWYEYTGLAPDESWEHAMHPEDLERTWARWRHSLSTGEVYETEYRFRHAESGSYRWFLGRAVPLRDTRGMITQWIGTNTDINDRYEAAQSLRERGELFRLITEAIPQGIWRTDPDGSADYCSQRFAELVGYSVPQLLGWGWTEIIHPEDRPMVVEDWEAARRAGTGVSVEFRVRGPEGRYRWFHSLGNPFRNAAGEIIKYYGTWTDIEDRKERAAQLQKLAETSLQLNSTSGPEEKFTLLTRRARDIVGAHLAILSVRGEDGWRPEANIISKSAAYAESLPPAPEELAAVYAEAARRSRSLRFGQADLAKQPLFSKLNAWIPLRGWLAAPLCSSAGKVIGLLQLSDKYGGEFTEADEALFAQLAQIASAAIENSQLLEREQAAVRARDEFLSIASHELKTPLTSLKLQTQTFQRMVSRGDARAYQPERVIGIMEQTNRQINRLTRLVDDMLDISRIRTGKLSIEKQATDLRQLVKEAIDRMRPQYRQAGAPSPELEAQQVPALDLDPVRMEQVLNNLLTNALRYGLGKPVRVQLELRPGHVRLAVKDQGLGIAPENQEKIFDRFERAVSANEVSGLGLGLFITRQIVQAHNGVIRVESTLGSGATFIVELPYSG